MSIGKRLTETRKEQSLNQIEFAELLGVSQSAYKNYERDFRLPPVSFLIKLHEAYESDLSWILLGVQVNVSQSMDQHLRQAIFKVEDYLLRAKQEVIPEHKTNAIMALFDYLTQTQVPSDKVINSILKAAIPSPVGDEQ